MQLFWVPCDHGSDHDVLLRFHFTNNMENLSSTSQRSSSTSIAFHLRELPLGISRISYHCTTSYWLWWNNAFPCRNHSMGSGLSSTENTAYLLLHHPFCLVMLLFDCILLKPLDIKCRGHHQHFCFFHVSIEFMVRNTMLSPRWFVFSSTTSFDSLPIQTWSYISCSAFPWERYTLDTYVSSHFPFLWSI